MPLPAAVAIVLDANHRLLLVKRRDIPIWVLPGGGVEPDETAEEAVIREVREETGYEVRVVRQSAEYQPINRLATVTSVFICHVLSGFPTLSAETAAIEFYPLAELPVPFFYVHAGWLAEAVSQPTLIKRPLFEVSYRALVVYFWRHPWQTLRFFWTRWRKT